MKLSVPPIFCKLSQTVVKPYIINNPNFLNLKNT